LKFGFLDYLGRVRGAARFEKLSNIIVVFCYTALFVSMYIRYWKYQNGDVVDVTSDAAVKVSFVFCILAAWLYLYYFLMGFDHTGRFVLVIYRIVTLDVPFFVTFYLIVLVAFGCAISLLTNSGNTSPGYGFLNLLITIFSLIQVTVSMQQNGNYNSQISVANVSPDLVLVFNVVFTSFYIVVVLMFLNLLIAIINSTYGKLIEYDDALLLIEKYNIMSAMQSSMWLNERSLRELPQSYSVRVDDYVGEQVIASSGSATNNDYDEMNVSKLHLLNPNLNNRRTSSGVVLHKRSIDMNNSNNTTSNNNNREEGGENAISLSEDLPTHYAFEMLDEDKAWWDISDTTTETDGGSGTSSNNNNNNINNNGGGGNSTPNQSKKKVILLLIMPQNDFHEGYGVKGNDSSGGSAAGEYLPRGSLAVPGSNEDSIRIRDMIRKNRDSIDEIIVAMDSHYATHIAHAIFWKKGPKHPDGRTSRMNRHPEPFTVITHNDVVEKIWVPVQEENVSLIEWCEKYTKELEKKGRLKLTIWPQHCIIGSPGHAVVPPINEAIQEWAILRNRTIRYEMKGTNLFTEMYSILAAEVEDQTDPTTGMDWDLLAELKIADKILVCGQALRYCSCSGTSTRSVAMRVIYLFTYLLIYLLLLRHNNYLQSLRELHSHGYFETLAQRSRQITSSEKRLVRLITIHLLFQ
jgi:nicotinamidase-related amidase